MQRLVLPYRYQEVLAGFKIAAYRNYWGYNHFGWDMWSYDAPTTAERGKIYASGNGKVVAVGLDNGVGNIVAVAYDAALLADGRSMPLVARYFHLARSTCFVGQTVTTETLLGIEGNTGTTGTHLHIEFDSDTQWPLYSPQVKGSNLIRKGTDTTVDPATVFWRRPEDTLLPSRFGVGWNTAKDTQLSVLSPAAPAQDPQLLEDLNRAEQTIAELEAELTDAKTRLSQIRTLATI